MVYIFSQKGVFFRVLDLYTYPATRRGISSGTYIRIARHKYTYPPPRKDVAKGKKRGCGGAGSKFWAFSLAVQRKSSTFAADSREGAYTHGLTAPEPYYR